MIHTDKSFELARQSFLRTAQWLRWSSPLFATLAEACAEDHDILRMLRVARPRQWPGPDLLFLFSVHYVLLKSPNVDLARYFPSLSDAPLPPSDAFATYREFCLDRRAEIEHLLACRTINTNLFEKTTCLLPALQHVATVAGEPLTLLEICCSAGLNLLLDEYHYEYVDRYRIGPMSSPVHLQCKLVGPGVPIHRGIPQISERMGIDLVSVDPSSEDDCLWMEAVLCPEWRAERERLRSALAIRRMRKIQTVIGDAVEVLPSMLPNLSRPLCVIQSHCIGQWSEPARAALDDILRANSVKGDIFRIRIEIDPENAPASIRARLLNITKAGISARQKCFPSLIELDHIAKGSINTQLLGEGDAFGAWLAWRANVPTAPS